MVCLFTFEKITAVQGIFSVQLSPVSGGTMMNKRKMQSLKRNVINVIIGGERMKNFNI